MAARSSFAKRSAISTSCSRGCHGTGGSVSDASAGGGGSPPTEASAPAGSGGGSKMPAGASVSIDESSSAGAEAAARSAGSAFSAGAGGGGGTIRDRSALSSRRRRRCAAVAPEKVPKRETRASRTAQPNPAWSARETAIATAKSATGAPSEPGSRRSAKVVAGAVVIQ